MALPVVFIMGTTATGKTDAAAALYDQYDAEIISVDSSLVYSGMDIGTAKPDADFLAQYPHHLIDVSHPNNTYSVADFYDQAMPLIDDIIARGKLPILVGGTHFYFSAIESGLSELPKANPELRAKIEQQAQQLGWPALHEQLTALDAQSGARIDPNDAQRIQRALEIVLESGLTVAEHNTKRKPATSHQIVKLALAYSDRAYLHERIAQRFDIMLEQGLEAEITALLADGVNADTSAMRMIGYRQMLNYLNGEINLDQARLQSIAATRQLAKRQLTWLRNQANLLWWVDFGLKDRKFRPLGEFVGQFIRQN